MKFSNPLPRNVAALSAGLVFAAALTSLPAAAGAATTPTPAPPPVPCSGPEWKQLDFWVGEWNATWPASPGTPAGSATNRIEKILGGCVVSENFEASGASPLIGKSYSTYSPQLKKWQQTWVDNQSSYIDLVGDFTNPGEPVFTVERPGPNGKPVKLRMVFKNIQHDSFDWSWERSTDGGKTWTVQWPIRYTRKKA
ncbi:MAG: DUF1579 family protein [Thermoanaerobaculia bacterium]